MLEPGVCAIIPEILNAWLEQSQLSSLELLTNKQALIELKNNMAVYTAAITGGAQKQVEMAGGDLAKRAYKFEQYLESFFLYIKDSKTDMLEIDPNRLDRNYNNCIADEGTNDARRYLITELSRYLENSPSWGTKVERIVDLLERSKDEATISVLDEMLSGFFWIDASVQDVFIDEKNSFALLHDFMGLITAQARARRGACKIMQRLTRIMAQYDMQYSRAALQSAFERSLSRTVPFNHPAQHTGNQLSLWELTELSKLHKKMAASGGWFASDNLVMTMETQVARRTGLLQLDEYTADMVGVFAKTVEILRIYPTVFGKKNIRRLQERLLDSVMRKDLSYLFSTTARSPMEQLSVYGILDQKIRKAKLPDRMTNEITEHLSKLQEEFIRDKKVFHKFRHLRSTSEEKGVYVLEMLMLGSFTAGRCKKAATKLLLHFIPEKEVLIEHLEATSSGGDDRVEEFVSMYDYFVMTA